MKYYTYYALYVSNEINLALLYKESLSEQLLQDDNCTYDEVAERIITDLRKENLKIVDGKILLEKDTDRFIHAHVIEDESVTSFKLYYIHEVDGFVDALDGKDNLHVFDDEVESTFHLVKNNESKLVHDMIGEYLYDVEYDEIKRKIIKDNVFEFFPLVFWMKVNEVDESLMKTVTETHSFTISVKDRKLTKDT